MRNHDKKYLSITALSVEALLRKADYYREQDTFEDKKSDNYALLVISQNLIIKKISRYSESMLEVIGQIYDEYNLTINEPMF